MWPVNEVSPKRTIPNFPNLPMNTVLADSPFSPFPAINLEDKNRELLSKLSNLSKSLIPKWIKNSNSSKRPMSMAPTPDPSIDSSRMPLPMMMEPRIFDGILVSEQRTTECFVFHIIILHRSTHANRHFFCNFQLNSWSITKARALNDPPRLPWISSRRLKLS